MSKKRTIQLFVESESMMSKDRAAILRVTRVVRYTIVRLNMRSQSIAQWVEKS